MSNISYVELKSILENKLFAWNYEDNELIDYLSKYQYNLFIIKKRVDLSDDFVKKLYDLFVKKYPYILVFDMINKSIRIRKDRLDKEKVFDTICIIVKELVDYENVSYADISYIGEGSSTNVFKIGNKVIKLGSKRETFVMPNDKRYLKPVIRTMINSLVSDKPLMYVEVVEYADPVNLTNEQLYEFYKTFRKDGKILLDFDSTNLGRLRKKNKVYFNDINPDFKTLNYTTESKEELEKDEIIILDNEYVVSVKEYYDNKDIYEIFEAAEFEDRYVYEKRNKII